MKMTIKGLNVVTKETYPILNNVDGKDMVVANDLIDVTVAVEEISAEGNFEEMVTGIVKFMTEKVIEEKDKKGKKAGKAGKNDIDVVEANGLAAIRKQLKKIKKEHEKQLKESKLNGRVDNMIKAIKAGKSTFVEAKDLIATIRGNAVLVSDKDILKRVKKLGEIVDEVIRVKRSIGDVESFKEDTRCLNEIWNAWNRAGHVADLGVLGTVTFKRDGEKRYAYINDAHCVVGGIEKTYFNDEAGFTADHGHRILDKVKTFNSEISSFAQGIHRG